MSLTYDQLRTVQDPPNIITYSYRGINAHGTGNDVFSSTTIQLHLLSPHSNDLFKHHHHISKNSSNLLQDIQLFELIGKSYFPIFIVLSGLDNCHSDERGKVAKWIRGSIANRPSRTSCYVNWLILSEQDDLLGDDDRECMILEPKKAPNKIALSRPAMSTRPHASCGKFDQGPDRQFGNLPDPPNLEDPKDIALKYPRPRVQRGIWMRLCGWLETLVRPLPPPGFTRITWESALGKQLYIDVKGSRDETTDTLQALLNRTRPPAELSAEPSSTIPQLPPLAHPRGLDAIVEVGMEHTNSLPKQSDSRLESFIGHHNLTQARSNAEFQDRVPHWLYLCFMTSKSRRFEVLDVTDISNDQYLFRQIQERYLEFSSKEGWLAQLCRLLPRSLSIWMSSSPRWVSWTIDEVCWLFQGLRFYGPKRINIVKVRILVRA